MSTMKIFVKIFNELDSLLCNIWWNYSVLESNGLGLKKFANMKFFSLLPKLGWMLAAKVDRRWMNILSSTYCRFYGFLNCSLSPKDSPTR